MNADDKKSLPTENDVATSSGSAVVENQQASEHRLSIASETVHGESDKITAYINTLYKADVPPEKIVTGVAILLKTQAALEASKGNRWFKPLVLAISTGFILLPLLPSVNAVAATAIASIGAVGFGTALYDIYGAHALKAGKSLKELFQPRSSNLPINLNQQAQKNGE